MSADVIIDDVINDDVIIDDQCSICLVFQLFETDIAKSSMKIKVCIQHMFLKLRILTVMHRLK